MTAILCSTSIQAQSKYSAVDAFVKQAGILDSQNMATVARTIAKPFDDPEMKARAIYTWIATNIQMDAKAMRNGDERKSLPEEVMKNRKATAQGFATLFQEMSSLNNIRCLIINGYSRNNIEDLNNPADEINHSWNVVQLGQSPQQWFYVDVCKASGFLDERKNVFTPSFTSQYFFAERPIFNLDHYPDNGAWQLGPGPKSIREFYSLAVIHPAAYVYQVQKLSPAQGLIKTKTKAKVNFSFPVTTNSGIEKINLLMGTGKRQQKSEPMNFDYSKGAISFSYQFKNEDSFPVKILINDHPVAEYMVEVSE